MTAYDNYLLNIAPCQDEMDCEDEMARSESYYVRHTRISCYDGELEVIEESADREWMEAWWQDAESHCEGQSIRFEVFAILENDWDSEIDFANPLFVKEW